MAFQVKDFASIVASEIAHMRATQDRITDFTVGSVARTLVEAPAIELDEFYQRLLFGLLESIPVAVFDAFGFAALPAIAATGDVTFTLSALRTADLLIPMGTIVSVDSDGRRYVVLSDGFIPAGAISAAVRVSAQSVGAAGNVQAGQIDTLVTQLAAPVSVTNLLPFAGGADEESSDDRKRRFIAFIGSLSRGTVYACEYAARSVVINDASGIPVEHVTQVGIEETPGHVEVYIYGSGGLPSPELLQQVDVALNGSVANGVIRPGYRPVGVEMNVTAMAERRIDVPLRVWTQSGSPASEAALRDAVARAMAAVEPGGTLYVDQIINAVLTVRDVRRVVVGIDENIDAALNEVLLPGVIPVTWEA